MLFRLTFLLFIFSILTTTARADESNPSFNSNIISITVPNIIVTTVALVTATENPKPNPSFDLRPNHNSNSNHVIKTKDYSNVIQKAYIKLEMREKKLRNNTETKWKKKSAKNKNHPRSKGY